MPHVDMAEQRVGFAHSLQDGNGSNPERHAHEQAPPFGQTERYSDRDENGAQHQLPITAQELNGPIRGLVNYGFSGLVCVHMDSFRAVPSPFRPGTARPHYTTAPATPNAEASMGAAKISVDTPSPTVAPLRPISLSSCPNST